METIAPVHKCKALPRQPECICGGRDVSSLSPGSNAFPFVCFWCRLDLFDTTYYAAITIGKCSHVVQSGGAVETLYSSIILFKFFFF